MDLWRIQLKPEVQNAGDVFEYCKREKIIGLGWPDNPENPNVKRFQAMEIGDLVWARDQRAIYYLARIEGCIKKNNDTVKHGLDHIRECELLEVGEMTNVPGVVRNSFGWGRVFQRILFDTAIFYSKLLYNEIGKEKNKYDMTQEKNIDIFELLSPDDLEDVVGLYLQKEKGYYIYPSTCKKTTPLWEYELTTKDGKKVDVQVKSGDVDIENYIVNDYSEIYLFSGSESYLHREKKNEKIILLKREEIREFIEKNEKIMTGVIKRWLDFCKNKQ